MADIEEIRALYEEVLTLRIASDHHEVHELDDAWQDFHDAYVGAIRQALGVPSNAPLQAILDQIHELKGGANADT
jgi:hypothetical protein